MKQRLTITVDSELLPLAKQYTEAQGISLSVLIERVLRGLAKEETLTFADKWSGKFQPAERQKDPRSDALANKYLS